MQNLTAAQPLQRCWRRRCARKMLSTKKLSRAAALFHGACLLSRWGGWQGCQSLRKADCQSPCGKWSREYSSVAGWVKVRMALVVVRSNTLPLRGSRTRYSWKPNGVDGFTAGAEGVLHEDSVEWKCNWFSVDRCSSGAIF